MRLKCISCEVFARPLYALAARSRNVIDIELIEKAKHNQPEQLRETIQQKICSADQEKYDALILGYGLCGKALDGIQALATPLVLPKAHDCITLFLGSRERYQEEFQKEPGTFWYIQDYVERSADDELDGYGGPGLHDETDRLFQGFVEKYGEDNALYLMKEMAAWQSHYKRAVFIETGIGLSDETSSRAMQKAHSQGWVFQTLAGNLDLLKRLLEGEWDNDFLVLSPGQRVRMVTSHDVIQISE